LFRGINCSSGEASNSPWE